METGSTTTVMQEIPEFIQKKGRNLQLVSERQEPEPLPTPTTSTPPTDPRIERLAAWEAQLTAKEDELKQAIKLVKVGLSMLAQRVLTLLALSVSSTLFGIALAEGSAAKIAAAAIFTALVFLPVLWVDAKN